MFLQLENEGKLALFKSGFCCTNCSLVEAIAVTRRRNETLLRKSSLLVGTIRLPLRGP